MAGLLKRVFYAARDRRRGLWCLAGRAELLSIVAGWLAALRHFWRSFFGGQPAIGASAEEVAFHQQQLAGRSAILSIRSQRRGPACAGRTGQVHLCRLGSLGPRAGFSRDPDTTPARIRGPLGPEVPGLRADATALANLYARAVYSATPLQPAAVGELAQLWRLMQTPVPAIRRCRSRVFCLVYSRFLRSRLSGRPLRFHFFRG